MKFKSVLHGAVVILFAFFCAAFFVIGFYNWVGFVLSVSSGIAAVVVYHDGADWKGVDRIVWGILVASFRGLVFGVSLPIYIVGAVMVWVATLVMLGRVKADEVWDILTLN